ncbi:uncharacterized protein LACBIDRAFT_332380 [Laccaria bicolor S238N-H82]|uniref:Predicted protein n=1 Tax=Laccaria bicolor (strain S238N-H82 / ATCC MYA-4686) TaxID=486041 RepID=B0DSJ2_LACBS|nr:uncharacterized protein LACBIDRAFT_332380 [Laccaria bicolor S238N-H82]EDR02558.1 predicted protein [Laccaria bicolor S238N-H82]|eukprot:XP_001886921.1 predicted protein [Laccaria bicolor S238N-H82]
MRMQPAKNIIPTGTLVSSKFFTQMFIMLEKIQQRMNLTRWISYSPQPDGLAAKEQEELVVHGEEEEEEEEEDNDDEKYNYGYEDEEEESERGDEEEDEVMKEIRSEEDDNDMDPLDEYGQKAGKN